MQVVLLLFAACLAINLVLVVLIQPSAWHLSSFAVVGAGIGLSFSFLYYLNVAQKSNSCQMVGQVPYRAPYTGSILGSGLLTDDN